MADNEIASFVGEFDGKEVPTGGMDNVEMENFIKFVNGESLEPPAQLEKMMNNIILKLSMGLGYNVVQGITRQAELTKFIAAAEKRLFDANSVQEMEEEEVRELHAQAVRTLGNLQEFQRKFIVQNKDTLKTTSTEQEKLLSKIMALPPDKMEKIMGILEGKEPEEKSPEEGFDTEDAL